MGMEATPIAQRSGIIIPQQQPLPVNGSFAQSSSGLYVPTHNPIVPTSQLVVPSNDVTSALNSETLGSEARRGYRELVATQGKEYADLSYRDAWPLIDRVGAEERHEKVISDFMQGRVEA
jgi:hypothetical protein